MRQSQTEFATDGFEQRGQTEFFRDLPGGYLTPVAYLWTRTVRCKNPGCGATVPLVKQTWLCKKKNRYIALKMVAPEAQRPFALSVSRLAVKRDLALTLRSAPKAATRRAVLPYHRQRDYVQQEGIAKRIGKQLMAVVCTRAGFTGKTYLGAGDVPDTTRPDNAAIQRRIDDLCDM